MNTFNGESNLLGNRIYLIADYERKVSKFFYFSFLECIGD